MDFMGTTRSKPLRCQLANHTVVTLRSTDGGSVWQTIDTLAMTYASTAQTEFTPLDRSLVFLSGLRTSVLPHSTDHGNSWQVDTLLNDPQVPYQIDQPYYPLSITINAEGTAIAAMNTSAAHIIPTPGFLAKIEGMPAGVTHSDIHDISTLQVFPNPSSNEVNIISSEGNISILDPLGRSYEVKQTGNSLDISTLPSGVYFVSDGTKRAKFVKE